MAAKLQCEICGGKLIGRPGGIFECDSCGMEYDTSWAKQKIQEITGTVKVEGTVDVQGTVKVDSSANIEALLQRGMMALEEEKWDEAKHFFDQALNFDAQFSEAYLGLAMVEGKCKDKDAFSEAYLDPYSTYHETNYVKRAIKFASDDDKEYYSNLEKKRTEVEAAAKSKDKKRIERVIRTWSNPASRMLQVAYQGAALECGLCIYGIKTDGRVLFYSDASIEGLQRVKKWKNIASISAGFRHVLGLRTDGTVVAAGDNTYGQCNVSSWNEVVAVKADHHISLGIIANGNILVAGRGINEHTNLKQFNNIIDAIIFCDYTGIYDPFQFTIIGLRRDGTIVTYGINNYEYNGLENWHGIKYIAPLWVGSVHPIIAGIKEDSVIYAVPRSQQYDWNGFLAPSDILLDHVGFLGSAGAGLYADGTVRYSDGTVLMDDVVELCGNETVYYGLHPDGSVSKYKVGANMDYGKRLKCSDGIAIKSSGATDAVFALCKDGHVYTNDKSLKEELSHWKLFDDYRNIDSEYKEAAKRAVIIKRNKIDNLSNEKNSLQTELSNLTGLFSGKRRKEIQSRLSEIDAELNKLK